jgi:hypothetical protein
MKPPRMRFTTRRLLIVILAAAVLLAVLLQVRDWQRRRVLIEQLNARLAFNRLTQAEMQVMSEYARRRRASSEELRNYEKGIAQLRIEGEELQERLSRLTH